MRKLSLQLVATLLIPCLLADSIHAICLQTDLKTKTAVQQSLTNLCALASMAEGFPKTRLGVKSGSDAFTLSSLAPLPRLSPLFPQSNPQGFRQLHRTIQRLGLYKQLLLVPIFILLGINNSYGQKPTPAIVVIESSHLFWPVIGLVIVLAIIRARYVLSRRRTTTTFVSETRAQQPSGTNVMQIPAPQVRKEREPVTPARPTLGEEIRAAEQRPSRDALDQVKRHLPPEAVDHVDTWPTVKDIDEGDMSALKVNTHLSESAWHALRALAAQEPLTNREYVGEQYAGREMQNSFEENQALRRASDMARAFVSFSDPAPASFHGRPIRFIKDLDAALREGSHLRRLSLPAEREMKAGSSWTISLEGPEFRAPWGFHSDHWALLFELASYTPSTDDSMGIALRRVAGAILSRHESESEDQHISDWSRTGLAGEGVEGYVLNDMRQDAVKRATLSFDRGVRPSVFRLIEDRTPEQFKSIVQALQGQSILLRRGPYTNLQARVQIWTTNDSSVGFVSPRGGRPTPQRISIDYSFTPQGPVLNIRVAGGFAASASDNQLAQVLLNPMLKLIAGLNDGQAILAESLYNAESARSSITSDLARHDLQEAFNEGRSYVLYEVIRRSIAASGARHFDNALFSMAKPRADVIIGLTVEDDASIPLYDEAGGIAGDLLVALIAQRARQPMIERLRLAFGDRTYPHDPASLSQMALVNASQFRPGLLEKLQGQEENRLQAGIDHAEEADLVGFHGERVATYMSGIDVMPFRSQFLVRYAISVKGNNEDSTRQFLESDADFVNEGTALAERVIAVNPSVVSVAFLKHSNGWVLKISGPEVQYRAVLRSAAPDPADAIARDPDLLGTFEIAESDFRDQAKRQAFFERIIRPAAAIAPMPMDYRRIMPRADINRRINQIPRTARPGVGFFDPTDDGNLQIKIAGLKAGFTNTTAFSAHGGFLYVADLSTQRGLQPVFYKIYPAQTQWFEEVTRIELPGQIKKDFGIEESSPLSLHMKWWEHTVRWLLNLYIANPSEKLVNAIVSGTEPGMLIGAKALSAISGLDLLVAPAAAVGFGALHTGRSNKFKAFATFWGLGVILLSRQDYLQPWKSYLALAAAQFIVNGILLNRHNILRSNTVETTLSFLKAA